MEFSNPFKDVIPVLDISINFMFFSLSNGLISTNFFDRLKSINSKLGDEVNPEISVRLSSFKMT